MVHRHDGPLAGVFGENLFKPLGLSFNVPVRVQRNDSRSLVSEGIYGFCQRIGQITCRWKRELRPPLDGELLSLVDPVDLEIGVLMISRNGDRGHRRVNPSSRLEPFSPFPILVSGIDKISRMDRESGMGGLLVGGPDDS